MEDQQQNQPIQSQLVENKNEKKLSIKMIIIIVVLVIIVVGGVLFFTTDIFDSVFSFEKESNDNNYPSIVTKTLNDGCLVYISTELYKEEYIYITDSGCTPGTTLHIDDAPMNYYKKSGKLIDSCAGMYFEDDECYDLIYLHRELLNIE